MTFEFFGFIYCKLKVSQTEFVVLQAKKKKLDAGLLDDIFFLLRIKGGYMYSVLIIKKEIVYKGGNNCLNSSKSMKPSLLISAVDIISFNSLGVKCVSKRTITCSSSF